MSRSRQLNMPFRSTRLNQMLYLFRLFMTILFQYDHVCCFSGNETVTKFGMDWNGMMKVVVPMGGHSPRPNQSMIIFIWILEA